VWTAERKERAKQLWEDGLSAAQIAAELGDCTRNAIVGLAHRSGWAGRAGVRRPPKPRPYRRVAPKAPPEPRATVTRFTNHGNRFDVVQNHAPAPLPEEPPAPPGQRCGLMQLREGVCRFPIGDPRSADFAFCGGNAIEPLPYCGFHARLSYQPVADRRGNSSAPRR
jgi:GcrA cell cycle regulator